jgi:4-amino-4-deoxy-L-arabinose transferase-like glycosyltransferase
LSVTQPGQAFTPKQIEDSWSPNHEHPPLDKVWSGLVWGLGRHIFDDLLAHRLGNMLLVAVMTALLFFMVAEEYGDFAGLGAAGSLLAMPRFFLHAHLAALDVPIAFMVFLVTFLFWRGVYSRSWKWTLLSGLVWGTALATKVNAFFILPTLFLWVIIFRRRAYLIVRIFIMGLIGMPFSILLWMWLYFETIQRLTEYIRFITVDHWKIGIY